tara:strand:- start:463 stop:2304 length:1842 start_codon:yes stop_codon:yes gene_type:complete
MKIVAVQDIKDASHLLIFIDKIENKDLKLIKNTKQKTLVLALRDSQFEENNKLYFSNKNIIVRKFSWTIFKQRHYYRYLSGFDSINILENFLNKQLLNNKKITNFINNLYQDKKIENAFKKETLNYLKKKFEKKRVFEKIKELNPQILLLNENIVDDNYNKKFSAYNFSNTFKKMKNLFYFIFYPLYTILILTLKNKKKSNRSIALRVYSNSLRINNYDYNLDWIKKKNFISEKEIIMVIEDSIDNSFLDSLKKSSYEFTYSSKKKPLGNFNLINIVKILNLFFISFLNIFHLFRAPVFYQNILLNAWMNYFVWNNFLSSFSPKVYLSYHDYLDNHIYRNIILKKKDCKTITYKHTNSENLFESKEKYFKTEFAYNCFDTEIHWSSESIEMSKSCKSQAKNFLLSSPLWSSKEFINKNFILKDLEIEKKINNKKIISVFSSAFGAFNGVEGHFFLLKFLKEVLEKRDDIFILFKPKYDVNLLNEYFDLKNMLVSLNENKMFKLVKRVRSINLINISDLTISMTYASPTIEAIAAGKKGFYVDLINDFPGSLYKKIDNFVADSIEDGLKKLDYWLSVDSNKFNNFLNNNINLTMNFNNESADFIRTIVQKEISK